MTMRSFINNPPSRRRFMWLRLTMPPVAIPASFTYRNRLRDANATNNDGRVRHDEGKATSFMRDEAGTHRFRRPRHPSRLELFGHGRPKTRHGVRLSRNPRKNFFLSVNYLTLLDRFLNDAA